MRKQNGFSLIELLIVVAIILVIAAIAVPNMLRSKIAANQASAVSSTRVIVSAELSYFQTYGGGTDFAQSLTTLGAGSANLLDSSLTAGSKTGYTFTLSATQSGGPYFNQFFISTAPQTAGVSGTNTYCAIEDAALRMDTTGTVFASHDACTAGTMLQ
jgi:prepilin-type N-terminal cleavage/methylation domain-containing protein